MSDTHKEIDIKVGADQGSCGSCTTAHTGNARGLWRPHGAGHCWVHRPRLRTPEALCAQVEGQNWVSMRKCVQN